MPKLTREEIIPAIWWLRSMPDEGHQQDGFHAQLADILTKRFGLDDRPRLSQETIADKYGIPKSRVQTLERQALRLLRDHFLNERRIAHAAVTLNCLRARLNGSQ